MLSLFVDEHLIHLALIKTFDKNWKESRRLMALNVIIVHLPKATQILESL